MFHATNLLINGLITRNDVNKTPVGYLSTQCLGTFDHEIQFKQNMMLNYVA